MKSEFNRKLPMYYAYYMDTFKLNVYVSQFNFNVTNKIARYTVQHKSFMMEKSNEFDEWPIIYQGFPY